MGQDRPRIPGPADEIASGVAICVLASALLTCTQAAQGAPAEICSPPVSETRTLLNRAYDAMRDGDRTLALAALRDALLSTDEPTVARSIAIQAGYLLVEMKRPKAATAMFLRAADIAEDAEVLKALGYAAKSAQRDHVALDAFRRLLDLTPADTHIHLEVAYLLKAAGRRALAAAHFRRALQLAQPEDNAAPARQTLLRREVQYMENTVDGGVSILWRARSRPQDNGDLSLGAQLLSQSQGLADVALPLAWPRPFGRAALVGRMIWAIDDADPTPARNSLQGGLGMTFRPFAATNLVLAGERLVAIEANARDDWLLRLAWSGDGGLSGGSDGGSGWNWSLYGDAAVIGIAETDIQLLGEGRFERRWALGATTVSGGAFVSGILQDDAAGTVELVEAGPSLAFAVPLGGSAYRAPGMALTLRMAWRVKLAGSADNRDSLTLTVSWRF